MPGIFWGGSWATCCCGGGTKICVKQPCGTGLPAVGATVQILTGVTVVDSCTTDATGCCTLNDAGTFSLRVIYEGATTNYGSKVLDGTQINVNVGTAQITCCGPCGIPFNLHLTDSNATMAFTWDPTNSDWLGSYAVSKAGVITGGGATCLAPYTIGTGNVTVTYEGVCVDHGDGTFGFQVSQFFSSVLAINQAGVPVYGGTIDEFFCTWSCTGTISSAPLYFLQAGVGGGTIFYTSPANDWTTCNPFVWSDSGPSTIPPSVICGFTFPAQTTPAPGTITVTV